MLITESAAIRIGYNLARVYYFTHTARGPCDSPNRPELDKGILASTVPNKAQPLRVRPACAWRLSSTENISTIFPTHSSTRGPAKPPYIARWPRIWDRAPMIKSKKVFGLSVPLYWICGSTEKCSKPTSSTRSLIDPSGLCPCDFIL